MSQTTTRRSRRRTRSHTGKETAQGEITTSTSKSSSGQKTEEDNNTEHVAKRVAARNPAYVRVAGGRTINLGDFESLRIDIAIEMPCEPNRDDILETYAEVTGILDGLMNDRVSGKGDE